MIWILIIDVSVVNRSWKLGIFGLFIGIISRVLGMVGYLDLLGPVLLANYQRLQQESVLM